MKDTPLPLGREGVYLFRSPAKMSAAIDRELMVVFCCEHPPACGALIFHPRDPLKNLADSLDTLFDKMTLGLGIGMSPIQVKLFGLSQRETAASQAVRDWIHDRGLYIAAEDVGKNVARTILVDCKTGAVGVRYSETYVAEAPAFLSPHTASRRWSEDALRGRILVLSTNPVLRVLAAQAIEETRGFRAAVSPRPDEMLERAAEGDFPWTHVLLFDDIAGPNRLAGWVEEVLAKHPKVRFLGVTEREPRAGVLAEKVSWLPPLFPDAIGEFKSALASAIENEVSWRDGGLLNFPKRGKSRKRR